MPELPEVETIRRTLAPHVEGRTVVAADMDDPLTCRHPADPAGFATRLRGRTVASLGRRGKYLLFELRGGGRLIVHLRMAGRLWWHAGPDARERFLRARLHLDDASVLDYIDMRRLGGMYLADDDGTGTPAGLLTLGPEALSPGFSPPVLAAALRGRRTAVKSVLLDQRVVAGIGNIYADEALHGAGIHPARRAGALRGPDVRRLHAAIVAALEEGVRAQGVSFSLYRDGEGRKGEMGERLRVYGRGGQPCYTCGTTLARTRVGGRGTALCPRCQRPPRGL